jgi:hypothetical protein
LESSAFITSSVVSFAASLAEGGIMLIDGIMLSIEVKAADYAISSIYPSTVAKLARILIER